MSWRSVAAACDRRMIFATLIERRYNSHYAATATAFAVDGRTEASSGDRS